MATIQNQQDDENQQNSSGPTTISGSGGAGGSGKASGVSQVQQNVNPQASQGYTDVASYLNANQNQEGSNQLGQQVASNLTNKYNQTKTGIDQSAQQFQGQVNQGYIPQNTDLINQVAANPTGAASDPNQLKAFQAQLNDQYIGPMSWGDYGTQQGKINEANQYGALATTPGGLNVYTQEAEGQTGGPQSQGINQLDTLLLGGNSGAVQNIRAAADPYKTLNDYINTQNTAGLGAVQNAQTAAQNASQGALNAFTGTNGTLTNLNSAVNQTASDRLAAAQGQNAALNKDLGNLYGGQAVDTAGTTIQGYGGSANPWYNTTNYNVGDLSPQALSALGIDANQWGQLKGALQQAGTSQYMTGHNFGAASPTSQIDLSQWLNQQDPTSAINAGTVATPEQYAQMSAIQQLLGDKTPQGNALNPALASLAGTAPNSFNQFNFNDALASAQRTAAEERQAGQEEANLLTSGADLAHAQSQHGGGFLGGLKNALNHPGNLLGAVSNPASWIPNAINVSKGQPVDPKKVK